jgi:hypothetical protein
LVDVLLVSRAAPSRPAPLAIFPILLHVAFLRLSFLTDQPRPDAVRGSQLLSGSQFDVAVARAISGVRRRAGECPAPFQIGERGNRFLRPHAINARCRIAMRSANFAQIYTDVPTLCPDARRRAGNHRSSAHPPKSISPRNAGALGGWPQQRSGVQTQFWSVVFIGDSLLQVNYNM